MIGQAVATNGRRPSQQTGAEIQVDHSSMMEMLRRIDERLENGNTRFTAIEDGLKTMAKDVSATKEIVEAYSTVKNVGRFVKWFGAFVAGVIAIGVGVKSGMIWLLAGLK